VKAAGSQAPEAVVSSGVYGKRVGYDSCGPTAFRMAIVGMAIALGLLVSGVLRREFARPVRSITEYTLTDSNRPGALAVRVYKRDGSSARPERARRLRPLVLSAVLSTDQAVPFGKSGHESAPGVPASLGSRPLPVVARPLGAKGLRLANFAVRRGSPMSDRTRPTHSVAGPRSMRVFARGRLALTASR
jgi:hypothetical protein